MGIFIARISKGRTIKEFLLGVLFVPAFVCFIFFAVFGVSALNIEQNGIAIISDHSLETTTFGVLQNYPLGEFMSLLTIVVIAIFFITSAYSATFVLGMLSTGGSITPANSVKILWGPRDVSHGSDYCLFRSNTRTSEYVNYYCPAVFRRHVDDGGIFLKGSET